MDEFDEYMDYVLTSVEVGFRKPNLEGYKILAEKLEVSPSDMIYVGNESKDIVGANQSGMKSIFIDRKRSGKEFGQDQTIVTLLELLDIV